MAITPFFPYLLYTLLRSSNASPLPAIFSVMFILKHCDRLLLNNCISIWRRSRYSKSCTAWDALTRYELSIIVCVASSSLDENRIFLKARTSSKASRASKLLLNKKLYSENWFLCGKLPSVVCKQGEQRKGVSKVYVHSRQSFCELAAKISKEGRRVER